MKTEEIENNIIKSISEIEAEINKTNEFIASELDKRNYQKVNQLMQQKALVEKSLSTLLVALQPFLLSLKNTESK